MMTKLSQNETPDELVDAAAKPNDSLSEFIKTQEQADQLMDAIKKL